MQLVTSPLLSVSFRTHIRTFPGSSPPPASLSTQPSLDPRAKTQGSSPSPVWSLLLLLGALNLILHPALPCPLLRADVTTEGSDLVNGSEEWRLAAYSQMAGHSGELGPGRGHHRDQGHL